MQQMTLEGFREELGLNKAEMGRMLGMNYQSWHRIETGTQNPTFQQKAALEMLYFIYEKGLLEEFQKGKERFATSDK